MSGFGGSPAIIWARNRVTGHRPEPPQPPETLRQFIDREELEIADEEARCSERLDPALAELARLTALAGSTPRAAAMTLFGGGPYAVMFKACVLDDGQRSATEGNRQ